MCYNVNLQMIHLRRRVPNDPVAFRSARVPPPEGASMAIYRVMYYSTVTVGSGGRITIPQEMRDDLELVDGDTLTTRLESSETGHKQLTIWKQREG